MQIIGKQELNDAWLGKHVIRWGIFMEMVVYYPSYQVFVMEGSVKRLKVALSEVLCQY